MGFPTLGDHPVDIAGLPARGVSFYIFCSYFHLCAPDCRSRRHGESRQKRSRLLSVEKASFALATAGLALVLRWHHLRSLRCRCSRIYAWPMFTYVKIRPECSVFTGKCLEMFACVFAAFGVGLDWIGWTLFGHKREAARGDGTSEEIRVLLTTSLCSLAVNKLKLVQAEFRECAMLCGGVKHSNRSLSTAVI